MAPKTLVIGTKNSGKFKEFISIIGKTSLKLVSLQNIRNKLNTKETGKTYKANALQKANTLLKVTDLPVLAEDSGLEVKALGNRPGIYSARYSGRDATPERNNQKLLKELENIPLKQRTARYRCVAVLRIPEGKRQDVKCKITEGICKGKIALVPRGKKGFGYDPLFIPDGYTKTFGELSPLIKNRISHRAKAIKKLIPLIKQYLVS